MSRAVHLFVPGALDQRTGGYYYDRQIVAGLRAQGRAVVVHNLAGRFPRPDSIARESVAVAGSRCAPGGVIVLDSLCLAAAEHVVPVCVGRGCTVVALVHHPASLESEHQELLDVEVSVLNAAQCCVATSAWTGRLLERAFCVVPERIVVVTPGVCRKTSLAQSSPLAPSRLLAVGTVTARKDYGTLLTAMAQIGDLDWELDCVGSLYRDPEAARVALSLVNRFDLDGRVRFHGELDERALEAAYRRSHLFVMASRFEGFGMVLTEALSYGLPIVAADAGPTPDVVPAECGRLVPPGNPTALAVALRKVMSDPSLYGAMSRAARNGAAALTGWDVTAAQFGQMLDRLEP